MVDLGELDDRRGARRRVHADGFVTLASSIDLSGSWLRLAHDEDVARFLVD